MGLAFIIRLSDWVVCLVSYVDILDKSLEMECVDRWIII